MVTCPDILAPADEDVMGLVYHEGTLAAQTQAHEENVYAILKIRKTNTQQFSMSLSSL